MRRAAIAIYALLFSLGLRAADAGPDTSTAAGLLAKAEQARAANQLDEAVKLYKQALAADASSKEGWWALGTAYYETDRYTDCRDAFRKLTKLDPQSGVAFSMLGLCEFSLYDYASSLTHLARSRQLGVRVPDIRLVSDFHLAELYDQREQFEDAAQVLAVLAHNIDPDSKMLTLTGVTGLRMATFPDDVAEAQRELVYLAGKAYWSALGKRVKDASDNFELLLSKYPNAAGVHYLYGTFLLQDYPDKAVEQFKEEIRVSPRHIPARAALAAEYIRRDQPDDGIPYAREAVKIAPDLFATHALLGRLLVQKGDLEHGVTELEKAEQLAPEDPQPHAALASVYAKLGRPQDAARERKAFVRLKSAAEAEAAGER